jgi:hypothetical protein
MLAVASAEIASGTDGSRTLCWRKTDSNPGVVEGKCRTISWAAPLSADPVARRRGSLTATGRVRNRRGAPLGLSPRQPAAALSGQALRHRATVRSGLTRTPASSLQQHSVIDELGAPDTASLSKRDPAGSPTCRATIRIIGYRCWRGPLIRRREGAVAAAAERIAGTLGDDAFQGDAHALLMAVYKDRGSQFRGAFLEAQKLLNTPIRNLY